MPIEIVQGRVTLLIRRDAFERAGLLRSAIDAQFNLTDAEFHSEGDIVVIGPLPSDETLTMMVGALEDEGLIYFDDFFELSGNWPEWLKLYSRAAD